MDYMVTEHCPMVILLQNIVLAQLFVANYSSLELSVAKIRAFLAHLSRQAHKVSL